MAQHRDVVALISLLEQVMLPPFGTAEPVRLESGNPAEGTYAVCAGNPSRPSGEWRHGRVHPRQGVGGPGSRWRSLLPDRRW